MTYVVEPGGKVREPPFEAATVTKPFQAGSEWTMELHKIFIVPMDPSKQKFKWITTEQQWRTVLKVHIKVDS